MDTRVFLSVQLALLFLIVSSPVLYSFVQSLLGRFFTVAKNGCPSTYGLLLHAVVFGLVVYGLMFLGKKVESFADGGDFTEALIKAFYNSDDDSDDSKKSEAELKKKKDRLKDDIKKLKELCKDKNSTGNTASDDVSSGTVETFAEEDRIDKLKKDIAELKKDKKNLIDSCKRDNKDSSNASSSSVARPTNNASSSSVASPTTVARSSKTKNTDNVGAGKKINKINV